MLLSHDVEFRIHGKDMQFVEIELNSGEGMIAKGRSMMTMDEHIAVSPVWGNGQPMLEHKGILGKWRNTSKTSQYQASIKMTMFSNEKLAKGSVSFTAPRPGRIIPMDLRNVDGTIICQQSSFLCAAKYTTIRPYHLAQDCPSSLGIDFQRLDGDGIVFLHGGGTIIRKHIRYGENPKVNVHAIIAMTKGVTMDIGACKEFAICDSTEDEFLLATLRGEGDLWLQSLPVSMYANEKTNMEDREDENSLEELAGIAKFFRRGTS